jgi:hypothetical protein
MEGAMILKAAVAALLVASQSLAHAEGHALGLKAGALGLGVEYTYSLSERVALRGGLNGSEYGFDEEESGIEYDFDFVWDSVSLAVDFHPLKSAFRLTAGYLKNDNRLEAVSTPSGNVTIGDTVYTPQQVGTLVGRASFDDATMLGLGWDWSRARRFGVSLDLGALDQGAPNVDLIGTGPALGSPAFQADIAAERAELEEALADLDVLPYVTLGFVFRF